MCFFKLQIHQNPFSTKAPSTPDPTATAYTALKPLSWLGRGTPDYTYVMYDANITSTGLQSNTSTISRNMWIQETHLLETETQFIKLRVLTDKE